MYNILGDPDLAIFTGIKGTLYVDVSAITPAAVSEIEVEITSSSVPIEGASVSMQKGDSLYTLGYTGIDGTLLLPNSFSEGDTIVFHAYKLNYRSGDGSTIMGSSEFYPYIEKVLFSDTLFSLNGSDSLYSAADSGNISVAVINKGTDTIFSLSCSLFVYSSDINLYGDVVYFDDTILPNDTALSENFVLAGVAPSVKNGQRDSILLWFKNSENVYAKYRKIITFRAQDLNADSAIYDKNTQEISAGDTLSVHAYISNKSTENALGVYVHVETNDTMLEIMPNSSHKNLISVDSIYITDPVKMVILDTNTALRPYSYSVIISDTLARSDTFNFTFYTGKMDYLVIDYDLNHNSGPIIDSLLGEQGYIGDYFTNPSEEILKYYNNVFLCLGSYPSNFKLLASNSIIQALDSLANAGPLNLFAEGGECGDWDKMNGGYDMSDLFGINGIGDGPNFAAYTFTGAYGTISNGMNFNYLGDGQYLDIIEKKSGAIAIFAYNTYVHGVSFDNGNHRTVGLSFEIGSLKDDSIAPSTKTELLYRIMEYFSFKSGVDLMSKISEIRRFSLLSSSPTIFNDGFSIRYASPANSMIKFSIYNIAGRLVDDDEVMHSISGVYTYNTKGKLNSAPSGVYFMRIDDGQGNVLTRKLTKIR